MYVDVSRKSFIGFENMQTFRRIYLICYFDYSLNLMFSINWCNTGFSKAIRKMITQERQFYFQYTNHLFLIIQENHLVWLPNFAPTGIATFHRLSSSVYFNSFWVVPSIFYRLYLQYFGENNILNQMFIVSISRTIYIYIKVLIRKDFSSVIILFREMGKYVF